MKTTLVVLAAGIGSRFGGGIKQLEPVGPNGEIIIDYSIHDAIKAGFNKIVFIIRHEIENDFKEIIGNRIEKICDSAGVEVAYAFQTMDNIPKELTKDRKKPWGTGHAVLSCDGLVDGSFAVINADDYYGKDGFYKAAEFLKNDSYGLVSYVLENTLSENGGVSRGLCKVEDGKLTQITETKNIIRIENGAESVGKFIDPKTYVSMNFWCLPNRFFNALETGFERFLSEIKDPLKDEFTLPTVVDWEINKGEIVTVLTSEDKWFGVTYKEDKPSVVESFKKLYAQGKYEKDLYSDI